MKSPASANIRNLIAACAAITVFGFAFGMTYPLLSLILELRGVACDMIGSVCGGLSMLASASHGLPVSLALVYLLLAAGVTWRQLAQQHQAS
jgi:hypothetical protein